MKNQEKLKKQFDCCQVFIDSCIEGTERKLANLKTTKQAQKAIYDAENSRFMESDKLFGKCKCEFQEKKSGVCLKVISCENCKYAMNSFLNFQQEEELKERKKELQREAKLNLIKSILEISEAIINACKISQDLIVNSQPIPEYKKNNNDVKREENEHFYFCHQGKEIIVDKNNFVKELPLNSKYNYVLYLQKNNIYIKIPSLKKIQNVSYSPFKGEVTINNDLIVGNIDLEKYGYFTYLVQNRQITTIQEALNMLTPKSN